jgi:hypothetical protein
MNLPERIVNTPLMNARLSPPGRARKALKRLASA